MASRFLQGDGYPILYRYNADDVLQEIITMPYVPDTAASYIRQEFVPYPEESTRLHKLLGGAIEEDAPVAFQVKIDIKYNTITASKLEEIYECILTAQTSTDYLKLRPRNDYNSVYATYRVLYLGEYKIESKNQWQHNVDLSFVTSEIVSAPAFLIPT